MNDRPYPNAPSRRSRLRANIGPGFRPILGLFSLAASMYAPPLRAQIDDIPPEKLLTEKIEIIAPSDGAGCLDREDLARRLWELGVDAQNLLEKHPSLRIELREDAPGTPGAAIHAIIWIAGAHFYERDFVPMPDICPQRRALISLGLALALDETGDSAPVKLILATRPSYLPAPGNPEPQTPSNPPPRREAQPFISGYEIQIGTGSDTDLGVHTETSMYLLFRGRSLQPRVGAYAFFSPSTRLATDDSGVRTLAYGAAAMLCAPSQELKVWALRLCAGLRGGPLESWSYGLPESAHDRIFWASGDMELSIEWRMAKIIGIAGIGLQSMFRTPTFTVVDDLGTIVHETRWPSQRASLRLGVALPNRKK